MAAEWDGFNTFVFGKRRRKATRVSRHPEHGSQTCVAHRPQVCVPHRARRLAWNSTAKPSSQQDVEPWSVIGISKTV